jgi:signal transduction histidine kinase
MAARNSPVRKATGAVKGKASPAKRRPARAKGKVRKEQAPFIVSTALLEELGERLVSKPEIALAELIKNSYDADAHECTITLGDKEIVVSDDGLGMTEGQFLKNWMVVSSQSKGALRYSRHHNRAMAGSKGIGRFSARYLGNTVVLTSVAFDEFAATRTRLSATFNWEEITQHDSISSVVINYTVEEVDEATPLGTALRITQLRREARMISASAVKTDILRLTNPVTGLEKPPFAGQRKAAARKAHEDPGFSVVFAGTSKRKSQSDEDIPSNLQEEILKAYVGRVRLQVDEKGVLSYQVHWRDEDKPIKEDSFSIGKYSAAFVPEKLRPASDEDEDERGLTTRVADIQQLPLATALHSPVFIDLRFFPKRKGTFSGLGINGTRAQKWIREHAGLALVDNHFAMASYGDGSDWLGIDASKARNERDWQSIFTPVFFPMSPRDKADPGRNPMLALPRGSQVVGRVHIATSKRPSTREDDSDEWLQPNMDRESLRENGAFRLLWHVSRFAAELIAHFDRARRLKEKERADAAAEKEAKSELTRAISDIQKSEEIEPEFRERIVQQLRIVQARYAEAQQYDSEVRVSLELMSMMGILAGFMTHEFEKAMRSLRDAAALMRRVGGKSGPVAEAAGDVEKMEEALAHYMDYMRLFIGKARAPKPQDFKAHSQVSLVAETLKTIAESHHIKVRVDIDKNLPGPVMPVAAYHGIVVNLISNALKALVPKASDEQRQVRLYATNDGTRHILVCADNGIGIPDYLRNRIWDPLFTTTSADDDDNPLGSGLGLGLSVVRQVVRHMRGSIELMDTPPPGFVTAFRLTLPLH